jgi:hypothetical protein
VHLGKQQRNIIDSFSRYGKHVGHAESLPESLNLV